MKIEFLNDTIFIHSNFSELQAYQINQLRFFGFIRKKEREEWYLEIGDNKTEKIIQIINYFRKQNLNLDLSADIENLINKERDIRSNFLEIRESAKKYKQGDFNVEEFTNFCQRTSKFPREFKAHQLKSAFHHCLVENSADFSVPGSGKTSSILLTYNYFRDKGEVNRIFVVGPPSSFSAWKNEFFLTLGREPQIKILSGLSKENRVENYYNFFDKTELFLITFHSLANDYQHIIKFFSHKSNRFFFVVDEAHYIKQLDGNWANAVLQVSNFAALRHVLTGTPCPHSYSDLFNLFDLIWGRNNVLTEIEKNQIVGFEKNKDYKSAGEIVKDKIDPLFYRVRKSDLGLKPQNFNDPIFVTMNKYERQIYDSIYKKISEMQKFEVTANIDNILSLKKGRIIRLRQAISYPKLLNSAIVDYHEDLGERDLGNLINNYDNYETPAKTEELLKLIKKIQKREKKIVIWSNFIGTINLLEETIITAGIGCAHIYGEVPIIQVPNSEILSREKIIERFLDINSDIDVLIANPAACAESISLHKTCHNTIYYDISYNGAQFLQSLDRIHRVGGSEEIIASYYFLLYSDTIDLDILSNLNRKREKMEQIIETNSDIYNLDVDPFIDRDEEDEAYDRIFT